MNRRRALLLATAPLLAGLTATSSHAADVYTGSSGNWSDGSKWSLLAPPAAGTAASLSPSAGAVTVTYDAGPLSLASFTIAGTGGATVALAFGQPTGDLTVTGDEIVGGGTTGSSNGTFNLTAGTNTVQSRLMVGTGSIGGGAPVGVFTLGAGGTLNVTTDLYVGFEGGTGTFTQTGGSNSVSGDLLLGYSAVATGTVGSFNLSDGQFSVGGDEFIGLNANGTFNHSGGSHTVGGTLYLGDGGAGVYSLSNGASLTVNGDEFVGAGAGPGTFNQTGGSHTLQGTLNIGFGTGTYTLGAGTLTVGGDENVGLGVGVGSGTMNQNGGVHNVAGTINIGTSDLATTSVFNLNGGTLNAHGLVNPSTYNQTGGIANLDAVSGTGNANVGGGAGTALASVSAISQTGLTIGNGGTVQIRTGTARITNNITALSIGTNGLLDLGNQFLRVDNTATPEATVRQYLKNGYNADATGIGNWLGTGGITSSDAIKSHNGANPDFRVSVGYVNGAYATDPLIGGSIPGQETLPTSKILIRPALYGDFNLDGKVDDVDLQIFSGLGQYNQPTDKFGWLGGDLNHDGKVDDVDLQIFSGAGNYNGAPYASASTAKPAADAPSLTGSGAGAAATTVGSLNDGVLDFIYDPNTGDLKVHYDGDTRVTAANPLQVIRFKSAGGHFVPASFNASGFSNVTTDNSTLNGTILGAGSLPDGYDLGDVLAAGLQAADLTGDLTLQWNVSGGGLSLKNGDVVVGVPEPAALGLLSAGALGLLARRRKRTAR